MSNKQDLQRLIKTLQELFAERKWDQFHSPKNLALNLIIEASELAEFFTWVSEEQSKHIPVNMKEKISEEVGDVFLTLAYFCHKLEIDIFEATFNKIEKIKKKYPAKEFAGRDTKFSVHLSN